LCLREEVLERVYKVSLRERERGGEALLRHPPIVSDCSARREAGRRHYYYYY